MMARGSIPLRLRVLIQVCPGQTQEMNQATYLHNQGNNWSQQTSRRDNIPRSRRYPTVGLQTTLRDGRSNPRGGPATGSGRRGCSLEMPCPVHGQLRPQELVWSREGGANPASQELYAHGQRSRERSRGARNRHRENEAHLEPVEVRRPHDKERRVHVVQHASVESGRKR